MVKFKRIGSGRYRIRGKHLLNLKTGEETYIPFRKRMPSDLSDYQKKEYKKIRE